MITISISSHAVNNFFQTADQLSTSPSPQRARLYHIAGSASTLCSKYFHKFRSPAALPSAHCNVHRCTQTQQRRSDTLAYCQLSVNTRFGYFPLRWLTRCCCQRSATAPPLHRNPHRTGALLYRSRSRESSTLSTRGEIISPGATRLL